MKYEAAMKWVEALRSGKYQQTTKKLKRGECFCALGVLCDISNLGEWSETDEYNNHSCLCPEVVDEWSELAFYGTIVSLNDGGMTFLDIADYIEKNWKYL